LEDCASLSLERTDVNEFSALELDRFAQNKTTSNLAQVLPSTHYFDEGIVPMNLEWWYTLGGKRQGPATIGQVKDLLLDGSLSLESLVWKQGFQNWLKISDVEEFREVLGALPPELPNVSTRPPSAAVLVVPLGAWRRFSARTLDLWIIGLPVGFLTAYVGASYSEGFALWLQKPGSEYLFGWLILPLILLFESFLFRIFASTPGKALLGVKVTTLAGVNLTGWTYLKRQAGVYLHGYGTGFPIVFICTMIAEYYSLRKRKAASYDVRKFVVQGSKIGPLRIGLAVVVAFGLVFIQVVLSQINNQSSASLKADVPTNVAENSTGTVWLNEMSGKSFYLLPKWSYGKHVNEMKQDVHVFSSASDAVTVVFAYESARPALNLATYSSAWAKAVQGSMALVETGFSLDGNGKGLVTLSGHMTEDKTQLVRAVLTARGRTFWRVVRIGPTISSLEDQFVIYLQEKLLETISD
jgi:hypothetical protein